MFSVRYATTSWIPFIGIASDIFLQCSKNGDLGIVQRYIRDNIQTPENVNVVSGNNHTALICAAFFGNYEIVRALLAAPRINLNYRDNVRYTALMHAIMGEAHPHIVYTLLRAPGIKLNLRDIWGNTAFHIAIKQGPDSIIHNISYRLRDIDPNDTNNRANLREYIEWDLNRIINIFSATPGIDPNIPDNNLDTPLHTAVYRNLFHVIAILLRMPNIFPDAVNRNRETALNSAVKSGFINAITLLAQRTTPNTPNIPDINGDTPLNNAVKRGRLDIVNILIRIPGINPNIGDRATREHPLICAIRNNDDRIAYAILLIRGIQINRPDNRGRTPLMWAITNDNNDLVDTLLRMPKINVNIPDNYGNTPLMQAADNNNAVIVLALLKKDGIEVDKPNKHGTTALMCAARNGLSYSLIFLLHASSIAGINSRNNDGLSARDIAQRSGHEDVVRIIDEICPPEEKHDRREINNTITLNTDEKRVTSTIVAQPRLFSLRNDEKHSHAQTKRHKRHSARFSNLSVNTNFKR